MIKSSSIREVRILAASVLVILTSVVACGPQKKLSDMQKEGPREVLNMASTESTLPNISIPKITRDTLTIKDDEGSEYLIMKAMRDDFSGEMVATEVLDAAVVTARFRNIAERQGKVNIAFQIVVPASMQDSRWQLRFYPDMYYLEDSIRLDPVIITGKAYRKAQLRGYQQYEKFLSSIVTDSTLFINFENLEIFLKRNIPEIYAFKTDTTYVSDEQFYSCFGVSQKEAIDHYTREVAVNRNNRRKSRIQKMYDKYVKSPIVTEGIRLDTVIQSGTGDFIYNYVQTINTQPKLKKVDIVLSGEIYEQDKVIYEIPRNEPLTFYISSLSEFTDYKERYLKQVVERQVEANTTSYVEFESGRSAVKENLGNNESEIKRIKDCLADLMNNATFDLDSIVVSAYASPEGSVALNNKLSSDRSDAISKYFNQYMKAYQAELDATNGFSVDEEGRIVKEKAVRIPFLSRSYGENWEMLDFLVAADKNMSDDEKDLYASHKDIQELDRRENSMKNDSYYKYIFSDLYPRLRTVRFNFYLHRKGMVKDTVQTTVIDSTYMKGIEALKAKEYEEALKYLAPYADYNAAVAYVAMDRNTSALLILNELERTADVNYLLAVIYSRTGDVEKAVNCYLQSVKQNPQFVHRGNLDPEIAILIKTYNLNSFDDTYEDDLQSLYL